MFCERVRSAQFRAPHRPAWEDTRRQPPTSEVVSQNMGTVRYDPTETLQDARDGMSKPLTTAGFA